MYHCVYHSKYYVLWLVAIRCEDIFVYSISSEKYIKS
jgi:hypothetical protein